MTGSYAEDIGGYGGPSDDGTGMAAWRMSLRLEAARESFTAAARAERTSAVLAALLAPLGAPEGGGVR